jgi:ring-1,2-phenylacetyl-CoA epoxidase subunit PaaE
MTPRFHPLTVRDVRRETPEAVSIAFDVPPALAEDYSFAPGQYLTLRRDFDGEEVRRSYSISSGLDDGELRIGVKTVPGGRFSTFATRALRAGDAIEVMTPTGRFTAPLAPGEARTHLAIAAGSGITPILSIVRSVLAREPKSRVVLLYGNRTVEDILFRGAIEDLKDRWLDRFAVVHVLSREANDVPLFEGRIDAAKIEHVVRRLVPGEHVDHAWLCGPFGLIDAARATLAGLGVEPRRIHVELFSTDGARPIAPADPPPAAAAPLEANAELIFAGRRHRVAVRPDEAILDAARRHGVDVPFSCKGGMCSTCRAKIVEGAVRMDVNYALEPWETTAGFVLTCQSHPTTERVVVDYDAL